MEIRLPQKEEAIVQDDIPGFISSCSKLYLICDSGLPGDIPALDSEGRAVIFTESTPAQEYVKHIKDGFARRTDPLAIAETALQWRRLGIERFILFTADGSLEEHTRAELLGHRDKSFLNAGYHYLRIRLRQARKYASTSKAKDAPEVSRLNEQVRLLEYELHSYMSHELLLLVSVHFPDTDIDKDTLIVSWDAAGILKKNGIYRDAGLSIYGGHKLHETSAKLPDKFGISCFVSKEDVHHVMFFTDRKLMEDFHRSDELITRLVSFNDLLEHIRSITKNESGQKWRAMINPGFLQYSLTPEAAENIGRVGHDTNVPKIIQNVGGKHTRINITGGKNNGCNS